MDFFTDILHRHGALVLFGVVLAEQLGLPLPALPLMAAAGVLIGTGHLGLFPAVGAAFLATLLADWLWYVAGQRRGRPVLALLCRIALEPDTCVRRTEHVFRTHGPRALVLAKFVPGLSTIAPPLAGVVGLGPVLFFLYDALGTGLWVGSGLGLGYAFGAAAPSMAAEAAHLTPIAGLAMVTLLAGYVLAKAWRRRVALQRAPRMTVADVVRKLDAGEPILFVDLRSEAEQRAEPGIPGARSIAIEELAAQAGVLPKDREIVFYCACPDDASSAKATLMLRRLGFERAWALKGGVTAWHARHQPVRLVPVVVEPA